MAKNSIFSGKDTKGKQKSPQDRSKGYQSKYYGSGSKAAQKRKQNAIDYTNKYRQAGFDPKQKEGTAAHERYKMIMYALPKNQRDMLRNKVDGEYYSSGDLLDAAEEIAQEVEGVRYFSKYQLDKKLAELKARNKDVADQVDSAIDDAIDLTPF